MLGNVAVPPCLLTDSYKITHYAMYPEAEKMVAYGEFRASYERDPEDQRIVVYGLQYVLENYVARRWTLADVELAAAFFATHNAGFTAMPFPAELFRQIVEERDGYFPVKLEVVPDGAVVYPHVPVYQMTTTGEFAPLATYLETVLTMVWYPSTVATLSRRMRTRIERAYDRTADDAERGTLASRLHDFGFRGCTSVEQSVIGGCAHLLSFEGTDTLSAAFYAQYYLNNGQPVATSIPATEHSVMLAHKTERAAMLQLLERFGAGACACVMDTFDYAAALEKVLPSVASVKMERGGFLVLRPDSGDPVEAVLLGLRAAERVFGVQVNDKGFKVLRGAGVIQGDAVTPVSLARILEEVEAAGYSASNVAFGMGGGLLQKVNRDTMSFATKLSQIVLADGTVRDVMKRPKSDSGKISLPGELAVLRDAATGVPLVLPREAVTDEMLRERSLLVCVYDGKPLEPSLPFARVPGQPVSGGSTAPSTVWRSFGDLREHLDREWRRLPPTARVISDALAAKIAQVSQQIALRGQ